MKQAKPNQAGAAAETASRRVTYYVALPFTRGEDGELAAGEAAEFQSPGAATSAAQALARKHVGAVAFSRTDDPAVGEFDDAAVPLRIGDLPDDLTRIE